MADQDTATQAKRIASNADRIAALRKKAEQAQNLLQAVENITADKQRAADTRRKIILGAIVMDALARGTSLPGSLDECLARITRDNDRKAFEGWSLSDYVLPESKPARAEPTSPPPAAPSQETAVPIYFQVPYERRQEAKDLGMQFDKERKLWFAVTTDMAHQASASFPLAASALQPATG